MQQKTKTQPGFSFMEVIVVTAIILIMTIVVLVVSWADRSTKELQAAQRSVAGVLREAQNSALTGKQYQDGRFPCEFTFTASGSSYRIDYSYHEGTSCTDPGGVSNDVATQHTLEANAMFVNPSTSIIFTVPFGNISPMGGSGYIDLPITLDGNTFHVCVYASGSIEERDAGLCT